MALDPQIGALIGGAGTIFGGFVMWLGQRRSGNLTMTEQQAKYINDQQQDINKLRHDFSELWEWAHAAIEQAARNNVKLPPLPRRHPRSEPDGAENRKESS